MDTATYLEEIVADIVDEFSSTQKSGEEIKLARVSIFGLGYVGAVSAACFGDIGHKVVGVDVDANKVARINAGTSPIVEAGLPRMLKAGVDAKRISATTNVCDAIYSTDVSFVCVGTPSAEDGSCNIKYLRQVSDQIGAALAKKDAYHVVVFRSTVPPGTTRKDLLPIIERASGKTAGVDFGVAFHPEFLRESTAIADFFAPPKTVVGGVDARSAKSVADMYRGVDEKVIETTIEAAEMVKYVDNTWHALKVSFANEVGKVCKASNVDSHDVMNIFCEDKKLNISSYYMKPGFAFGGSCLPKDVRGINCLARKLGVRAPVLGSIIPSNGAQILHAIEMVEKIGAKRIGFLGLSFKAGTDDLRESPMLPLLSSLADGEREIRVYDRNIDLKNSVRHHMAHSKHDQEGGVDLATLLPEVMDDDLDRVVRNSDVLIVSHRTGEFQAVVAKRREGQHVVDLIRLFDEPEQSDTYHGICW